MNKVNDKLEIRIVLPRVITSETVSEFHSQIQDKLNSADKEISLDCSNLDRITSTHISLIWSACEECKSRRIELTLNEVNSALKKTLEMLDIASLIKIRSGHKAAAGLSDSHQVDIQVTTEFQDRIVLGNKGVQIALKNFILFLHELELPKKTLFEIRTAFYEVLINIRDHSGIDETGVIEFRARADNTGMQMIFKDRGVFFDPTKQIGNVNFEDAAKRRQSRGFGLLMIKKLVNHIKYSRIDDKINCLELTKLWSQFDGK